MQTYFGGNGFRRAWIGILVFLWSLLCIAHWVNCCRPEAPAVRPTTIPVVLDEPNTADSDEELERAER